MDKKTILRYVLAIGLTAILMVGFFLLRGNPGKTEINSQQTQAKTEQKTETIKQSENNTKSEEAAFSISPIKTNGEEEADKNFSTKDFNIVFSTKGAIAKSIKLNHYKETDGSPIEMIISGDTNIYPFGIAFGEYKTNNDLFSVKDIESENAVEFSKSYKIIQDKKEYEITLKKKYVFKDEYIIDLLLSIECKDSKFLPLNFNGTTYSLEFGPQIGPGFKKELSSNEYRYYTYFDNQRSDMTNNIKENKKLIDKSCKWVAIEGKYFIVIAYPTIDFKDKWIGFDGSKITGIAKQSSLFFNRPYDSNIASINEKYKFYIGPKIKDILDKYTEYDFQKAVKGDFWDWIIWILKWVLSGINYVVKNWGLSIIILTILIKVVFFPLTQKGLKASIKMQVLNPKIQELQAKYKDNPQKMQAEIGILYKKEGVSPLSGCLPWLIQMPVFFALYGLLNNQFELRGAPFILGWINDLSAPEHIFTLPFSIPFITNQIRLLPFLVLATQFIQQKLTQTPGSASAQQMKLLLYALPVVFFFIMYHLPSGLSLYWTMQNLLSIVNQLYNNFTMKKPKPETQNVIKKK